MNHQNLCYKSSYLDCLTAVTRRANGQMVANPGQTTAANVETTACEHEIVACSC